MVRRAYRPVAQLVEHRSPKPGAGGSRPSWPASLRSRETRASYGWASRPSKGGCLAGALGAKADERYGMATNVVSENIGEARENVTGWWNRARTFFIEVRNELKRVTWPSRKEVYAATLVVILFSLVLGLFLWVVDLIL